jgi:hypothetical protein
VACSHATTSKLRTLKYLPTNYAWNLSVDLAIEMSARIGEIEEMCAPLQEAAKQPDAAGTRAFRETWSNMGDKLCDLAKEDEARGSLISAGEKSGRAATCYVTAERLQAHARRAAWSCTGASSTSSTTASSSPAKTASASRSPTATPILVQVNPRLDPGNEVPRRLARHRPAGHRRSAAPARS